MAIAIMAGLDPRQDQVKTFILACLTEKSIENLLKDIGIEVGKKIAIAIIKKSLNREILKKINQAVGFRLLTKFGEKEL